MPLLHVHAAWQLLALVAPKVSTDFSGLGIVFYDSLGALPFIPLDVGDTGRFVLPIAGLPALSDAFARTAKRSSRWHDGFHFVHSPSLTLTHLCQFIAPPLPTGGQGLPQARGARHMTALLASQVTGIVAVGLLSQEGAVSIYESGLLITNESLS